MSFSDDDVSQAGSFMDDESVQSADSFGHPPFQTVAADTTAKGGTFMDQYLAIMERTFRQMWRKKIDVFLQLFIPMLFVVITLILWIVWPPFSGTETQFVSYKEQRTNMNPNLHTSLACYDSSGGNYIPGLYSCDMLASTGNNISCDGDESSLPVKGLCYVEIDADFSHVTSNGYELGAIEGAAVPVQLWINSYDASFFTIPSLDAVITFQWLARKSDSNSLVQRMINAGLMPNAKQTAVQCSGALFFVGNDLEGLVQYFHHKSQLFQYTYNGTFKLKQEAEEAVRNTRYNWAIIEFKSFTKDKFDVTIRMNSTALPSAGYTIAQNYAGGWFSERSDLYAVAGFLSLQQIITEYYLQYVVEYGTIAEIPFNHYIASAGYVDYSVQPLLTNAGQLLPFIFVLSFLYPVSQLTKRIVLEKETRIRESMLIMGLGNTPLYLSWYTSFLLPNIFILILTCVIVRLTYFGAGDVYVMVLIYFVYILTCVPLSGFLSAFFSKARLASLLTPLIYFVLAVPLFAITSANSAIITIFCILPPTAFSVAMMNFLTHEIGGGFTSEDWNDPLDEPKMSIAMIMLAVDFVLYNLLMVYLDAVMPNDWGTPKHPLFFIIQPYQWLTGRQSKNLDGGTDGRAADGYFEEEPEMAVHAVELCGLRKEYKRGSHKFLAVNNLYWGMCADEISVLLGHNGAGKTTVLNMMTGMVEPDEGDCYIYELSVRTQLKKVRQQIGFCPQHNILWPELTCRDHLEFFGKIKGLKGWALEEAVCRMLHETDLMDKMEQPAGSLSGGMKRKLSVSIAFVGSSRLIFLDEPTAGMDVGARRYTWELLRRMSQKHTIMLTTHYMDEADLLGHRIGIMSQGRLKCSGSSMYLKSKLGIGYSVTMSLMNNADVVMLSDLVLHTVEGANEMGINGCEAMFRLPNTSVKQFPALLDALELEQDLLGVRAYSLSATTLEEVFLRVSEDDIVRQHARDPLMASSPAVVARQEHLVWHCDTVSTRGAMWRSQFSAMMVKRFWNGIRDRRMQCFQIVCPMVCILIAMLLSLIDLNPPSSILLQSGMYPGTVSMDMCGCDDVLGPHSVYDNFVIDKCNYANTLNLSWYEVDTFLGHPNTRLGGVFCNDTDMMRLTGETNVITHLINSSSFHQAPVTINAFYSAIYERVTGVVQRLSLTAGTLPKTSNEVVAEDSIKTILMGAIIMIPFTFLPSNPVAWVVKERECKARHLQNVSGLRFFIYWITNFLFDMVAYVITMLLVIIIFVIFWRTEYIASDRFGPTFVLFLCYGFSSTTTGYLCSFLFDEHSTAQTVVMAVSFVAGFLLVMIVYILSLLADTRDAAMKMRWATRLVPSFSIGEGIINLAMLTQQQAIGQDLGPWSMDTIGWVCVYMAIEFPIFGILTLIIDHPSRRMWSQNRHYDRNADPQMIDDEDSDVEEERLTIYEEEATGVNDDMVRMVNLRKVYPNGKEAVRNLTFGVVPGEVFGFLGTNGAGKTTAIAILCQEFIPTSGSASVCGYDTVRDNLEALQCIGYCPQFDALLDLLSVEEHLRLYAGVRGIVEHQRDDVVAALLRLCELSEYRSTLASRLSGGNRRKLSVALSLIGGPRVVFLDEPSAGMDPVARRGLWNAIEKVAENSSVVLTTHHLEEVEALAHRVAIMVDGALHCIGDKTHLKKKYGSGFEMSIRVRRARHCDRLRRWVAKYFPTAELNECKGQRFVYTLPADCSLSRTFRALQRAKTKLRIVDYSVSHTSIEQVFLRISGELEEVSKAPVHATIPTGVMHK